MGAWGHGYFDDDSALDFMAEVEDSTDPKQTLKNALGTALESDYLESDEGTAVIITSAYIDSQLNGTKFTSDRDEPFGVDTFSLRHPNVNLADLKSDAVIALTKVLSDNSELNELWSENEEDYPSWRSGVENLIQSLSK